MDKEDNWTDEEFETFTKRLEAFHKDPESLASEVREKCFELHKEIENDAEHIEHLISQGVDLSKLPAINPKRQALVEWLAKTP